VPRELVEALRGRLDEHRPAVVRVAHAADVVRTVERDDLACHRRGVEAEPGGERVDVLRAVRGERLQEQVARPVERAGARTPASGPGGPRRRGALGPAQQLGHLELDRGDDVACGVAPRWVVSSGNSHRCILQESTC
jgi:hypothetical protein